MNGVSELCVNMKLLYELKRNIYLILLFKEMGVIRKSCELNLKLFLQLGMRKNCGEHRLQL